MDTHAKVAVKKVAGVPPFRAYWDDSDLRQIQDAIQNVIVTLAVIGQVASCLS